MYWVWKLYQCMKLLWYEDSNYFSLLYCDKKALSIWIFFQITNLEERLQIKQMTNVQQSAIPPILNGQDVMVKSQTGSGWLNKDLHYMFKMRENYIDLGLECLYFLSFILEVRRFCQSVCLSFFVSICISLSLSFAFFCLCTSNFVVFLQWLLIDCWKWNSLCF